MASVRRRDKNDPASPWVCEYTDPSTGARRRITPKTGLKKDADAARRRIEGEIERGEHVAKSQTATLAVAADAWLRDCDRRRKLKDRMCGGTFRRYAGYVDNHIVPELGNLKLTAITYGLLQSFINEKATKLDRGTVEGIAVAVGQTLRHAVDHKWLVITPLANKPLRIPGERKKKAIPDKEEIQAILRAASERNKLEHHVTFKARMALVLLAVFAGLRRGEIAALMWKNVDLEANVLHVRHSFSHYDGLKAPKSAAGYRTIPLVPQVADYLRSIRPNDWGPDDFVLFSDRGTPLTSNILWKHWMAVMKKAGLIKPDGRPKYTLHALRHANVSLLIALGLQPLHISKLAGHSSVRITLDIYGHLFPDDGSSRAALEAAAAQFNVGPKAALEATPPTIALTDAQKPVGFVAHPNQLTH